MDTTSVTVNASNLMSGATALGADGNLITGTLAFSLASKVIVSNGTYIPENGIDGFNNVIVS